MSDPFANLVTRGQPRQRLGIPGRPFDPVRVVEENDRAFTVFEGTFQPNLQESGRA